LKKNRNFELVNERTGQTLVARLRVANDFLTRLRGLLGRKALPAGEGIFFPDCNSIHMFMMLFSIDVVYVDAEMRVVKIVRRLKPWRLSMSRKASGVIEVCTGEADKHDIRIGDHMIIKEN